MADGKGFAGLLSYVAALNKEAEKTPAIIGRISDVAEAEPVTDALSLRRADAATPVGAEVPAIVRILGQMRAVSQATAEAQQNIEALSARADEISEEVPLKISKALSAILDPGNGEGVSGKWDKDTGKFLGGAFSNERARDLVDRFNELLEIQSTKLDAFQTFYVNESLKLTAQQFRTEFGSKLGDIKGLAKMLRDYLAATARKDSQLGPTSGTLGRAKPATSTATVSLAVLRWRGGLP